MKSAPGCASSCCWARCQNNFCWWQKAFALSCCKGLNWASFMLDIENNDRNSSQKWEDALCEPSFQKGRDSASISPLEVAQHWEPYSTAPAAPEEDPKHWRGFASSLGRLWSICVQNKPYTFFSPSFFSLPPSFFLSTPTSNSNLPTQTPKVYKNNRIF